MLSFRDMLFNRYRDARRGEVDLWRAAKRSVDFHSEYELELRRLNLLCGGLRRMSQRKEKII